MASSVVSGLLPDWVVEHVVLVDGIGVDAAVHAAPVADLRLPFEDDGRTVTQVDLPGGQGVHHANNVVGVFL
jgi:hypothetical protein